MNTAAVLYVGDLARMAAFYQRCFEMTTVDGGPDYLGLRCGPWVLTLVKSSPAAPATSPPQRRTDTAIKLAFEVSNIAELRSVVAACGGQAGPAEAEWTFRSSVHCDCVDPEGNVIQLIQPNDVRSHGL
jgi:predicted enzyme related to lactoylglutathione lyase